MSDEEGSKFNPWWKFASEKWESEPYVDEEDFTVKRKTIAEEWKNLSDDERKPYLSATDSDRGLFMNETLDPSETPFDATLTVFRTFYSDADLDDEPETDWWENLKYMMIYDNNKPYYIDDWSDRMGPWYENREILDGVKTPQEFVERAIIGRHDFSNLGYDTSGVPDVNFLTVVLADEKTAETGMLRMLQIENGTQVISDYRMPAAFMKEFYNRHVGLNHTVERYIIENGLDDRSDEALKQYYVDLRRPIKDVFKEQLIKDNKHYKPVEPKEAETAAEEAIEEIGRMMEARELMGE